MSFIPGLSQAQWLGAGVVALGLVVGTAWVTNEVNDAAYQRLKNSYKDAEIKAVTEAKRIQAEQHEGSLRVAVAEASKQVKIVEVTHTIVEKVNTYVPIATKCPVTVGFMRVFNASVLGVAPAPVSYAPGQSDDACAAVDPRTLALNIAANFGACWANAQQLTSLQEWVRAMQAATPATAPRR